MVGHEVVTHADTTADLIPDLVFHLYLNGSRDQNGLFMQESGL